MTKSASKLTTLGLAALVMGTSACGSDIDSKTAQQSITSNTVNVSERVAESLTFLENSELFARGLESMGGEECTVATDGSGADFDTAECDTTVEFESADFQEASAELAAILEQRVFVDGNIETEDGDAITYLLRGNVVCSDGVEVDPDCADGIDQAKVRLVVTSPDDGDIDVDVLLGDARHNPLSMEFHQDALAATVRLQGLKGAIEHFGVLEGETPELPDTMSGTIRAELATTGAARATATLSIIDAIQLSNDDWSFDIAAANPAAQITADAGNEKLEALVNLGRIQARFPSEEIAYDFETDTETIETHAIALDLGGLTGSTVLEAQTDTLILQNLGLGQTTSTLGVDGNQVLAIDLNPDDGRKFGATLTAGEDSFEVTVTPAFDLRAALSFINAPHMEADDWAMDEMLTIRAAGTDGATMRSHDSGMELVAGTLDINLENAAISLSATAGQCLLGSDDVEASVCAPGEICESTEPTSTNPFDELTVGSCTAQ